MTIEKPTLFYREYADSYPDHPEHMGYQRAEIEVFYSIGLPTSCSSALFRLTYQRNYDELAKNVSYWYGEDMESINSPRYDKLKDISMIFQKMEKFLDNLRSKGLSLDVSRADDYHWRLALLQKLGAYPLEWNKEKRKYSSYKFSRAEGVQA